ncbi:MAG: N-acetylmuramoyl-L-alanine amidase [Elusimicrobiota bacterium]
MTTLVLGLFLSHSAYANKNIPISIVKDGQKVSTIDLVLIKKMGYLRSRDVADIFGAEIDYNKETKCLDLRWDSFKDKEKGEVNFKVGSEHVVMNGIKRKMMKTPLVIENHVYLPLEAIITRAFEGVTGAQINWSYPQRTLWISYSGNIADVRYYTYDKYTRFVIEMTGDLPYEKKFKDNKLVINLNQGKLAVPVDDIDIDNGIIKNVVISTYPEKVKFCINIDKEAGEYEITKFPSPPRIVVDVEDKKSHQGENLDDLPPQPAGPPMRDRTNIRDIKLVVIDPGHGGRDPGAIGPHGTREKDVTLEVSKLLASKIRKKLKRRAVLTRTHDYFVPLAKRTEIANSKNADIFISIHANASLNHESKGFEVYFLSEKSSDMEAQAVANMENSVVAMEEDTKNMDRVSRILWSLTMNQFMNESSELCSFINDCVIKETDLHDRGVKQAGFYVMKGARMPAVLIELAFVSNKREERLLNSRKFQEKVADGICEALFKYKKWIAGR